MKQFIIAIGFISGLAWSASASAERTAQDVVQCMRDNFPESVSVRSIRLTTIDATGTESILAGRLYAQMQEQDDGRDLIQGSLFIEEPRNMYGAAYLVLETEDYLRDGMFVYMPAVGRVRRITGNFADGPMMGTKFSYFEFKQMANAFGDLKGEYVGEETFDGRLTHIVDFKPVEGVGTQYTRVKAWIDQKICLISKAEFYAGQRLIKRLISPADSLRKAGSQWYFSEVRMHDMTDDARTIMNVDRVTTNEDLSRYRFSPKSFYEMR